jgi:trimeric autotransporter adhesin
MRRVTCRPTAGGRSGRRYATGAAILTAAVVLAISGATAVGSVTVNGTLAAIASLNVPASDIAVSNNDGTIYVADAYSHQVLQLDVATDHVTPFAGSGTSGFGGDGTAALSAELEGPSAVDVDHWGDVVIVDAEANDVRVVAGENCSASCPYGLPSMVSGDIYTAAGVGGVQASSRPAQGAVARSTAIEPLADGAWDGTDQFGDLLIADWSPNADVFIVSGQSCASSCPYGLSSMTAGDIYWIAGNDFRGNTSSANSGNGGPATQALLVSPGAFAVDSSHDLLIDDQDTDEIRLVAGQNCAANCPFGFASLTAGDIYSVVAFAGEPEQLTLDASGNVLIADPLNFIVDVLAGSNCASACPYGLSSMKQGDVYLLEGPTAATSVNEHGPLAHAAATIGQPGGLAFDPQGTLFVQDESSGTVDEVHMTAPVSTTPTPLPVAVPAIAVASNKLTLSHSKIAVKLSCTLAACSGKVLLSKSVKLKIHEKKQHKVVTKIETTTLASASYTLTADATASVILHLTHAGRHALAHAKKHAVHAALSVTVLGGSTLTSAVRVR